MSSSHRLFRDPVSGFTHLAGTLLGAVGLVYLLVASASKDPRTIAAVTIYGVSMILLYASSSTYHLLNVRPALRLRLRRLDHAMVSLFIAGTYTPFCLLALRGVLGTTILAAVWILALGGVLKSIYWVHAPRWVTAGIFVLMGWIIVLAVYPLSRAVTPEILWYIVGGGLAYTVGAFVYAKKWPDPWPNTFGFHEIWHLFVLAGSALHYVGVFELLA